MSDVRNTSLWMAQDIQTRGNAIQYIASSDSIWNCVLFWFWWHSFSLWLRRDYWFQSRKWKCVCLGAYDASKDHCRVQSINVPGKKWSFLRYWSLDIHPAKGWHQCLASMPSFWQKVPIVPKSLQRRQILWPTKILAVFTFFIQRAELYCNDTAALQYIGCHHNIFIFGNIKIFGSIKQYIHFLWQYQTIY